MKPVRLGIVGARRGSSFARTALGGLDGRVQLTSVCDIDSGVLAGWRREHPELAYYQSYEQFLAHADVGTEEDLRQSLQAELRTPDLTPSPATSGRRTVAVSP